MSNQIEFTEIFSFRPPHHREHVWEAPPVVYRDSTLRGVIDIFGRRTTDGEYAQSLITHLLQKSQESSKGVLLLLGARPGVGKTTIKWDVYQGLMNGAAQMGINLQVLQSDFATHIAQVRQRPGKALASARTSQDWADASSLYLEEITAMRESSLPSAFDARIVIAESGGTTHIGDNGIVIDQGGSAHKKLLQNEVGLTDEERSVLPIYVIASNSEISQRAGRSRGIAREPVTDFLQTSLVQRFREEEGIELVGMRPTRRNDNLVRSLWDAAPQSTIEMMREAIQTVAEGMQSDPVYRGLFSHIAYRNPFLSDAVHKEATVYARLLQDSQALGSHNGLATVLINPAREIVRARPPRIQTC